MGYHRLWSHKTYKANKVVSYILLVFGTAALQNSVLQWASDHRKHHKDVDDPIKDPYAATRGFGTLILLGCSSITMQMYKKSVALMIF